MSGTTVQCRNCKKIWRIEYGGIKWEGKTQWIPLNYDCCEQPDLESLYKRNPELVKDMMKNRLHKQEEKHIKNEVKRKMGLDPEVQKLLDEHIIKLWNVALEMLEDTALTKEDIAEMVRKNIQRLTR